jgi:hypothetical protein
MNEQVDFVRLRRLAPGRFTEDMLQKLGQGMDFEGFHVTTERVELGEDPFVERLEAAFVVSKQNGNAVQSKGSSVGPTLYFTFSADTSVDENIAEFREFVREHAATAAAAPRFAPSPRQSIGHTGD